jgi:formylglycine-generating enzyme required for sulfatase activity
VTLVRDSVLPVTLLKAPNGFGLFDMHGNVSEFCQTNDKSTVVARGGSFRNTAEECTANSRSVATDGSAGLRLVAIPNAKTKAMENVSSDGNRPVPTELQNSVGMEFVLLNAGQFQMGAPENERSAGREEKPQHVVEISKPFYMGRFEVSQAIYARVMDKKKVQREGSWRFATKEPSAFSRDGHSSASIGSLANEDVGNLPVESISWQEANEFCQELNKLISEKNKNRTYRLPTEAEWEYACRAGTDTAFSFGNNLNGADANVDGTSPYGVTANGPFQQRTEVVGRSGPANAFGLFDMHGNVWEWCQDFYSDDYYGQSQGSNPTGPASGSGHVLRGGAWNSRPEEARSAARRSGNLDLAGPFYGFRVVLEVSP